MNERKTVSIQLSRLNSDIARFLARLVAEEDPTSTVEYTFPLGRAAHLLSLQLQQAAAVAAMFSRFEDFGPEDSVEDDEADEPALSSDMEIAAGVEALRANPFLSTELLNELFGDAGAKSVVPAQATHREGKRIDDQI